MVSDVTCVDGILLLLTVRWGNNLGKLTYYENKVCSYVNLKNVNKHQIYFVALVISTK
ncbi:hypothetical protein HOLleu_02126 [Holothuria leucospilota]|uniref:Uncharacterized protein n=1 Tax=Holothuria leucospilota TaxID=206669 RepID=A0A9Q1CQU6_HOLLE|nr:hypothetical protein HOLleu_02126 [Holothuria leucospilota]